MSEEQISEEVFQTIIDSIDFNTADYDFSPMIIEGFDDYASNIVAACERKVDYTKAGYEYEDGTVHHSDEMNLDVKNIVDDYVKDFPKNYYDFIRMTESCHRMIGRRTFNGLLQEVLNEKFTNHLISIYEEKFGEKKDYKYFDTFEKTDFLFDFYFGVDFEDICNDYIESRYKDICNKLMSLVDCNSPV